MGRRSLDKENLPCSYCKQLLPTTEFTIKKTGYAHYCKPCAKEYSKKYREINKEKLRVAKSEYHYKNKQKNREVILEKQKLYRIEKKEDIKRRWKKYYENHKNTSTALKWKSYGDKWKSNNKEHKKAYDTKKILEMGDGYVKTCLRYRFDKETIEAYPELIKVNRELIKIKRLCKASKN